MGRLIPLRLQPSDTRRSSISFPSTSNDLCAVPAKLLDRRPRPGPVTDLTIIPYTEAEWRQVMEEVKILYMKRQYKQCSARCIQILSSIKDPYRVHPLYQIYLCFFAASSLELTSRSLHLNTSAKLPLLQQSLTYYQNAESHMEYASFSADPTIVQAVRQTRQNSISSVRSSVDSVFSHTSSHSSTSSSILPSPTSSICSTSPSSDATPTHKRTVSAPSSNPGSGLAPPPLKVKKKVSFSLQLQLPRLLSDAELDSLSLASPSTIIDAFPAPPTTTSAPPTPPHTPILPLSESSISDFLLSRALIRYRGHLSDLYNQIRYHISSVKSQIEAVNKARKAWRSNLPTLFTDFRRGVDGVSDEEMKKVELRARIERLKEGGWQRERFDGRRYQELCDKALGELE